MVLNVAAGCTARSCINVQDPIKVKKLREWAESDARFLRKLSMTKKDNHDQDQMKSEGLSFAAASSSSIYQRSESLERLVCRQLYLRSYTFDKQPEKDDTIKLKTKSSWLKLNRYWKVLEKDNNNNNKSKTTKKSKEGSNSSLTLKGGFKFLLSFFPQADVRSCSGKPNHQY